MNSSTHNRTRLIALAALVAATTSVSALGGTTAAAVGVPTAQPTVVAAVPATATPNVTNGTVYAITSVGSQTILGGSFTSVQNHGSTTTLTRTDVLAFDSATGAVSTSFAPTLDGTVQAVAPGPTAGTVYVGGVFSTVNGVKSKGITLLDTTTGQIAAGFKPPALNGAVQTIASAAGHVLIGGSFTAAGTAARGGVASLNPTTGALDSFFALPFTGHHNYNGSGANGAVGPRAMAVNPAGTRLMVIGNFTTAGSVPRDQVALIDLDGAAAAVDASWSTLQYTARCFSSAFDTYVTDVQYSPDGSYFAITATGGSGTNSDGSRSLCDSVSRWSATDTGSNVQPAWVDYTGQDTLWSVAITGSAVYVGGHQRWLNNSNGYDAAGAGAVPRAGLAAVDPVSGVPLAWNPGRNPRGAGAYALYATANGLYVGSDTDYFGDFYYKHQKIGFFPLAKGVAPASTAVGALPANLYLAGPTNTAQITADGLGYRPVSGSAVAGSRIGTATPVPSPVAWGSSRGAFVVGNQIFYGATDGTFSRAPITTASSGAAAIGTPTALDPYEDPAWSTVKTGSGQTYLGAKPSYYSELSSVTGAFYSGGRLYYTQAGQSPLFWRWFSPDSGIVGSQEFSIGGANFSNVAGLTASGTTLYYASSTDGTLHSMSFSGAVLSPTTDTVVSGPGTDGLDWRARSLFLYGPATFPNTPPTAAATSSCTQLNCRFDGTGSADPDVGGSVASYAWTFGDGATGSGATPTHGYASAGTYPVSLVVTDDRGATSTAWTGNVSVTAPVTPIGFVGAADANVLSAAPSVTVPAATQAGDTEVLFVSAATNGVTTNLPSGGGWQQVGRQTNAPLETTVFARSAPSADAGSAVTVALTSSTRVDLQLAVYRGVAATAVASAADSNTATHVTPTAAVTAGGSWLVSYWSVRTSSTTTWSAPSGVTSRGTGVGTGGGHVDTLTADTGPLATGSGGAFSAGSGAVAAKGDTVSVVLTPGA